MWFLRLPGVCVFTGYVYLQLKIETQFWKCKENTQTAAADILKPLENGDFNASCDKNNFMSFMSN